MQNPLEKTNLVLLPGLDGTGELFEKFIEQFPEANDIITIAYPSDRFIPFTDLPDYIISKLPKHQPLVLLGESYSGPVAAVLASRAELDVHGVIFVATFAKFSGSLLKSLSRLIPLSWLLQLPIPDIAIRLFCFGQWTTPELAQRLRTVIKANRPEVLAQRARNGASLDVCAALAKIDIPCLYIQASNDKLVPARAVIPFKTQLKFLQIKRVEGPHFILQTQSALCAELVKEFIEKLKIADI